MADDFYLLVNNIKDKYIVVFEGDNTKIDEAIKVLNKPTYKKVKIDKNTYDNCKDNFSELNELIVNSIG